jgi:deoxyribodipyrimidine photolyase
MRAEAFARHWFRRFCTAEDLVDAWAAYRLFRLSADRRCLLWCYDDMRDLHAGNREEAFFATNIQSLHQTLRENEKKLAEGFLNCKVDENLAPWMHIAV